MRGGLFARAAAAGGVRGRGRRGRHDARAGRRRRGGGAGRAACRLRADRARGGAGVRVPPAAGVLEGRRRRRPPAGAGRGRYTARRAALPRGRRRGRSRGICAGAYRRPADASAAFCPSAREPFRFTAERAGQYIDGAALRAAVEDALARGAREAEALILPLSPRRTLAEVKKGAALLASFTTYYADGGQPRPQHRAGGVAAERLRAGGGRGALLQRARGRAHRAKRLPRSARHRARRVCRGGGRRRVCQVSTTLYNAALLAGLSVAEVHPHSLAVGYVPPSRDAMVSGSDCDLKLKNVTGAPAYILARAEGRRAHRAGVRAGERRHLRHRERGHRPHPRRPRPRCGRGRRPPSAPPKRVCAARHTSSAARRAAPSVRVRLRQDSYAPVRAILQRPDPDNTENPAASGEPVA